MSARPVFTLVDAPASNPVAQAQAHPVPHKPVQLTPVSFGVRDAALGHVVCEHLTLATPPTVIRFNPFTHARLRRGLRSLGIHV